MCKLRGDGRVDGRHADGIPDRQADVWTDRRTDENCYTLRVLAHRAILIKRAIIQNGALMRGVFFMAAPCESLLSEAATFLLLVLELPS